MKISKVGYFFFSGNSVIYSSPENRKILKKQGLSNNQFFEVDFPFDYESLEFIQVKFILVKTRFNSMIFDLNLNRLKTVFFGIGLNNSFFNNFYFVQPSYFVNGNETRFNIILDEETRQFTTLPITEDIKFFEFHDEYFIPVTYLSAAQNYSYGPSIEVYNYEGKLVWSKDFTNAENYESHALYALELLNNVRISNIKFWNDYVLVSTNFIPQVCCYNVHTGVLNWSQKDLKGIHARFVVIDEKEGYAFVMNSPYFVKIKLDTGEIVQQVHTDEWVKSGFQTRTTDFSNAPDGIWTATMNEGRIGRINKETLMIDQIHQLETFGVINGSAAPHVTDEFIVIPDGLGNLEIIKRN